MSEILRLRKAVEEKKISREELFGEYLKRAKERNSVINSYISFAERKECENGALSGIPCAIKDNLSTEGQKTTCASQMLSDYVPFYDAFAVSELKKSGAAVIGKTNMDEFAIGSTGETSFYGAVKNPLDTRRAAGGSSSGSAACVADKTAVFSLGTDTGGSVRLPAAYNSVIGLAPTYSLISRYGLISYASSLDRVGIIAETATDAAIVLKAVSGKDERDMTNSDRVFAFSEDAIKRGVKNMKIGVAEKLFGDIFPEGAKMSEKALGLMEKHGARIEKIGMDFLTDAMSAYKVISAIEASSNLLRYDGVRYGKRALGDSFEKIAENTRSAYFGREVKKKILFGCCASSSGGEELKNSAIKVRSCVKDIMEELLSKYDLILMPSAKALPPFIGEKDDSDADIFLIPASLSGHPSASVPIGKMTGIQIVGRYFAEEDILRAAHILREAYRGE